MNGASPITLKVYGDIQNVIQMIDCLLLIICIYFGFARKETVCEFYAFAVDYQYKTLPRVAHYLSEKVILRNL